MNSYQQITINNSCSFEGVTLHSGEYSKITLHPSPANTGIKFKRIDSKLPKGQNIIPANFKNIRSSQLCTTIENDYNLSVSTIEHLMAALYSYGIDNLLIDIETMPQSSSDATDASYCYTRYLIKNISKLGRNEIS